MYEFLSELITKLAKVRYVKAILAFLKSRSPEYDDLIDSALDRINELESSADWALQASLIS